MANIRVLVQSGWSEISQEWFAATAMDLEVEMGTTSSALNSGSSNIQGDAKRGGGSDSRSVRGAGGVSERITLSSGYGTYEYDDSHSSDREKSLHLDDTYRDISGNKGGKDDGV